MLWNVYVWNTDLDWIWYDNDPVRCGLAAQTLMNATLHLLLYWFASLSWHRFPALGLTGGTSTRRCTSIKVSISEPAQMLHILKHTGERGERNKVPYYIDNAVEATSAALSEHVLRADYLPPKHFAIFLLQVCEEKRKCWCPCHNVSFLHITHHENTSFMCHECWELWGERGKEIIFLSGNLTTNQ